VRTLPLIPARRPFHDLPQTLGERRCRGATVLEHNGHGQRRQRNQARGADPHQYLRFADANQRDAVSRAEAELIDDGNSPEPRGPANLRRFNAQLMARINATMANRLKVS